jgi:hypothetical protein
MKEKVSANNNAANSTNYHHCRTAATIEGGSEVDLRLTAVFVFIHKSVIAGHRNTDEVTLSTKYIITKFKCWKGTI